MPNPIMLRLHGGSVTDEAWEKRLARRGVPMRSPRSEKEEASRVATWEALQNAGPCTYTQLARHMGIHESLVQRRVEALVRAGRAGTRREPDPRRGVGWTCEVFFAIESGES